MYYVYNDYMFNPFTPITLNVHISIDLFTIIVLDKDNYL